MKNIYYLFLFVTVASATPASYAMRPEEMEDQLLDNTNRSYIHLRAFAKEKFINDVLSLSEQTRNAKSVSPKEICEHLTKWNALKNDLSCISLAPIESYLAGRILDSIKSRLILQL